MLEAQSLKKYRRDFALILIVMAAFYIQHLLSFNLGINFEEGRDGNAYFLAMEGYKPYRDFEWIYGPFSFLIYPFTMKIFGLNLIVLRFSYIIFASLVIPLTYFLARNIMPPFWSGMASFLAVNFFDVPYYTYNHIFACLGELLCLLMLIRLIKTKKYVTNMLWAGFFAAITLLTKPFLSGVILIFAVFLFLIIMKLTAQMPIRLINAVLLFFGAAFLITSLFSYLYLGGAIKNFFLMSTPFSQNFVGSLHDVNTKVLGFSPIVTMLSKRFFGIFAINKILFLSSFAEFKTILVDWFDDFIFCLPFLISFIILIIYGKFKTLLSETRHIFIDHKIIALLVVFSTFISTENFVVGHRMGRAFNIQTTFILLMFVFYFLLNAVSRKRRIPVFSLIIFLTFSLSFLHFFRYPWSRKKKFTQLLSLERARGVRVTPSEKELFESLVNYLSNNIGKKEKLVILGYNPHFIFLSQQENLFKSEEGIFLKLEYLTNLSLKDKKMLPRLRALEDTIISAMESERPKVVLDIVFEGDNPLYNNLVGEYIKRRYVLTKTFGPAEIQGIKSADKGRVDIHTLKKELYSATQN